MDRKTKIILVAAAFLLRPEFALAVDPDYNPPPPPPPAPSSTINIGSNVGKKSQTGGAAANNQAGAQLIAKGMALLPNPPTSAQGAMLIAMGMMALAQGAHDAGAAGKSADTGAHSVYNNGQTQMNQAEKGTGEYGANSALAKDALKKLSDEGYKYSSKGLTKPDGTLVPASAFQSSGAMKAAGLDPEAVKIASKIGADVAQQYGVSGVPTAGGGGGSGGAHDIGPGGGGAESEEEAGLNKFNAFGLGSEAQRDLIKGKTVSLDGEPIGVAGMNIFEMVHDAYQKKRSGEQFMESEDRARVRAPASVKKK